jgi:putative flippase GtrA
MSARRSRVVRWLKFNLVGAIGIVVQLAVLAFLKSVLGANYLLATALAVEVTIIHNFAWHERFTWAERATNSRFARFVSFNLSNGAISLFGNLAVMRLLTGLLGANYFVANMAGIAVCSFLNFAVSDQFVFAQRGAIR